MVKAKQRNIVACEKCDTELYICEECGDYFRPGQEIVCTSDGKHFHKECKSHL